MSYLSIKLTQEEQKRFDEAYNKFNTHTKGLQGCVRSKKEFILKMTYYFLLNNESKMCKFLGQSFYNLEKKLQETNKKGNQK